MAPSPCAYRRPTRTVTGTSSRIGFPRSLLRVRWTLTRTSTGLELGQPKTAKSRRTVPLPNVAVAALEAQRVQQEQDQREANDTWREHGLVFTSEIGTPLELRNALRAFGMLARRADLDGISLHTLRHSAASLLLAAGVHTRVVQEHLGYSSFAITADVYSHSDPVLQREAAAGLDDALEW
jgi:integrase